MSKFHLFSISLIFILFVFGCDSDDPNKPQTDPCEGKSPVSADFFIYEVFFIGLPEPHHDSFNKEWQLYDSDTIATGQVYFKAKEEDAEYEWHLGAEIIRERSFMRENFPRNETIPVTLIIKKEPDNECFPEDDGIDTLTRTFYVIDFTNSCPDIEIMSGVFRGVNEDSPLDTFDVEIERCFVPPHDTDPTLRIANLVPGCEHYNWERFWPSFKQAYFWAIVEYDCLTPEGYLQILGKNNDTLLINYNIQIAPTWDKYKIRVNKTFKGVRL